MTENKFRKRVLDTNVLLDRPLNNVLSSFEEPTHIIIPLVVLNELDKFKKGTESINENCRASTRFLDKLRTYGNIKEGVPYEGHIVQVEISEGELDLLKNDHRIIQSARTNGAILVSQDINVRVVSDALNIEVENFAPEDVQTAKLYTGIAHIDIDEKDLQEFMDCEYQKERFLRVGSELKDREGEPVLHNQFVCMTDPGGGIHEGIYKKEEGKIRSLLTHYKPWNISAKKDKKTNQTISEQRFLLHLLLDPEIQFVSAIGPSGCGKTFLTWAAALEQVLGNASAKTGYTKIVAMRPLVAIGQDIGYLPGDKFEKLEPWMGSTFDTLGHLLTGYNPKDMGTHVSNSEKIQQLILDDVMELEAMAHIRGRSIPNQFIIVDDAQNLTREQAASIITRAGEGTKVVFLGDISDKQIDNHRLTPSNNGLAYVVDRFKGEDIVGHVTLEKVVRSRLAQLGVEKL